MLVSKKQTVKVKPKAMVRKMSRKKPGKKKKTTTTTKTRLCRPKKLRSQSQTPSSSSSESVINNNNNNPDIIQNLKQENEKVVVEQKDDDGRRRFYGCYLLTSLSPRFKGHSYIGFTVNPKRRIRQHNGEITCGAFKTKKKRPWEMILCIHGFPSHASALQFEWAWQHPRESLAVREAAASFKTLGGLANKIKLALTMLTLHTWQSMNLTVSFFSTKYMNHAAGCPTLPQQMKLHFCSMDELPCYSDYPHGCDDEDDFEPNDSGVSTNYSDERLGASADDSMEMIPPSDHLQSCATQNSSDSSLAEDQIGAGGSLEFEPSSVMDVPEELMQPVHQLPVDVSGSMQNTSNELLWPGEEFWDEDFRGSFPDLEERVQPTGSICTSDNNIFPALVEKQEPSCQLLADVPTSTWNDLYDQTRFQNKDGSGTEERRGSVHVMEEQIQPFQQVGPEREQSAMVGLVSVIEDAPKKDETSCIIIDDINEEQCQPKRVRSPLRLSNAHQTFSTEGIEVIELCTPSPDFRITTGNKKRRANSSFPDIIDLTRSPSFIQL